ncbi:DUF4157 domain-containing protein [Zoogloea sp.]|uniref:eCIS core domain-containing protein n=1 Tax=Zoogloea sp. TaxID=49181 RepID=UPI0026382463|nr:DUF4157 domain-containing protein [Zoogloea sp.]MDD3354217.1 DUF4157 domain-containing protein [Zoogloea sp.]
MNAVPPRLALRAPEHAARVRPTRTPATPSVMRSASGGAPPLSGLRVSSPRDAAEQEATRIARQVVTMPSPGPIDRPRRTSPGLLAHRQHRATPPIQAHNPVPGLPAGGQPLPPSVRAFMEPRFGTDFSAIRIHTDTPAAQASRQLNAAAFTVGHQIFFGQDAWQPTHPEGRELIAHELTHTIQQGAAPQPQHNPLPVTGTSRATVQRLGTGDVRDYFADHARHLPGFRLCTLVLGRNPITMHPVERSPANLLRAMVEVMPGGALITRALDNHAIINRVAGWIQQQTASLGQVAGSIRPTLEHFLSTLGWRDLLRLNDVWAQARRIVTEPITRIRDFVGSLLSGVLQFIRTALLRPLAGLAQGTQGWDLLCAVLGSNPITGEAVPRTAATLIGGFMRLIGQGEVWQNLLRGHAVERAWSWFQGALGGLVGVVGRLPGLFMDTLHRLGIADLLTPVQTFTRVGRVFGSFAGQFFQWAGQQVIHLLEILFEAVAPSVTPYLRRAAGALRTIIANPAGFIRNLVRAASTGLRQFAGRFLNHLRAGLLGWLTGTLNGANLHVPRSFTLPEIVKFVLSVLGLSWQHLRGKLVRVVGEPAVTAMETGFNMVVTLVRQGPAAAWERIQESLSNLREMVMEQIMTFVRNTIVTAAITRLVASLNPAGAFIQAILAIYTTVTFLVERLRQIAQVGASLIDSLAAIASGAVTAAANRVEQTMAGLLTLVISFLARLMGLGRISDAVTQLIQGIRGPIDRALDRVVDWIVTQARRLGRFVAQAGLPADPRTRLRLGMDTAVTAVGRRPGGSRLNATLIHGLIGAIRVRYGFRALDAVFEGDRWWIRGEINPTERRPLTEDELTLLREIRAVADQELAGASTGSPVTASGTHEAPRAVPAGSGLAGVSTTLPTTLPRGGQEVLAIGGDDARGVIRRPPFGDAIVTGASPEVRRIRIGRYRDVAATLSSIGNDRFVAEAARELLRSGEMPVRARHLSGWFGGFRTLMALEVRRDPVALTTLASVLTLAQAGALTVTEAFTRASESGERTEGGLFTHSAPGALATLRQVRDEVGAPQRPNAPASRASRQVAEKAMQDEVAALTRAARILLRTNAQPRREEIVQAVRQALRSMLGPRIS